MGLQRQPLKQGIITLMTDMMERAEPSYDEFAERLSLLIESFVKTGHVTVAAQIPVATTGTATAQTGATQTTGHGTIS